MRRLAVVVEGHGEVDAVPSLAARILKAEKRDDWIVSAPAIRLPRSQLVDESVPSPNRPPRSAGFQRGLALARAQKASAVLVLVDADDDCPAAFGPEGTQLCGSMPGRAVMAVREFETWLLWSYSGAERARAGARDPHMKRDAKKALAKIVPNYLPSTHQKELARKIDLVGLRKVSPSFDKFVRSVPDVTI